MDSKIAGFGDFSFLREDAAKSVCTDWGFPIIGGKADNPLAEKFGSVIESMLQPRVVERNEADVRTVFRDEKSVLYAVAYHWDDGETTPEMLIKVKKKGWVFKRTRIWVPCSFVNAYISSIWGCKKLTELQTAQCLAELVIRRGGMEECGNFMLAMFPGGIVASSTFLDDEGQAVIKMADFLGYEDFERDEVETFYREVLRFFVVDEEPPECCFPESLKDKILERLKKEYGNKNNE